MKIVGKTPKSPHLEPHRYADGTCVVSKSRFKEDQKHVSYEEIPKYVFGEGLKLRMSDPITKASPRLISPRSIAMIA